MPRTIALLSLSIGTMTAFGCTSKPPVCYDEDDARRPDRPHLIRDSSGQCVLVDNSDASLRGDAGPDAMADDSGIIESTKLTSLQVALPATMNAEFTPERTAYEVEAPFLADELIVTVAAEDDRALIQINGTTVTSDESTVVPLAVGSSDINVVISGHGVAPTTYKLSVVRTRTVELGTYFKASNTDESDRFGTSVAISEDTLVVGAPGESSNTTVVDGDQSDNQAGSSGAAYVFRRTESGWAQEAYLKAPNTDAGDAFGSTVAIAGDTLAVGAPSEDGGARQIDGNGDDNTLENSGAVYVYRRTGTTWTFHAYLKASNADSGDRFGTSLALQNNVLVVGAPIEGSGASQVGGNQSDNSKAETGAAYVFRLDEDTWSQEVYLKASNADEGDHFGESVGIADNTVVVGAPLEDGAAAHGEGLASNNNAAEAGAAYVFRFSSNSWSEEAYVKASNTEAGDRFGTAVSLSGTTLVVGAEHESSNTIDVDGDQSNNDAGSSGAAYVFDYVNSAWVFTAYLKASNTGGSDNFGAAVTIDRNFIAVGAPNERSTSTTINGDDNNDDNSVGAAYLFYREGDVWKPHAYVKGPVAYNDGYFGSALALGRGTLAVGHENERGQGKGIDGPFEPISISGSGAVFTFE